MQIGNMHLQHLNKCNTFTLIQNYKTTIYNRLVAKKMHISANANICTLYIIYV